MFIRTAPLHPHMLPQCISGSAAGEAKMELVRQVRGLEELPRESGSEDQRALLGLRSARAPAVRAVCRRANRIRSPDARESPASEPTRY